MRLRSWGMRVVLTTLVILSIVFTWQIWQNPSRLGRTEAPVTVAVQKDPNVAKQESTVFLPRNALFVDKHQKWQLLLADTSVVASLHDVLQQGKIDTLLPRRKLNHTEFQSLLTSNTSLQLVYPDMINRRLFMRTFFNRKTVAKPDFHFNRLIVHLADGPMTVELVNDQTRQVVSAKLRNVTLSKLKAKIAAGQAHALPVVERRVNEHMVVHYPRAISVQPYSLLVDDQSANHYVSQLMPPQEASTVDVREIGGDTIYTAGSRYRITAAGDSEVMRFDDTGQGSVDLSLNQLLTRAYASLGQLGLQGLYMMRYIGIDQTGQVNFQANVRGLPVVHENNNGLVQVALTASGRQITFATTNLTVPIPTDQAKVTLPPTDEVLDKLTQAGYSRDDIEEVVLGYDWPDQDQTSQVVTLQPTYLVAINGRYRAYNEWLAAKQTNN